MVNYYKLNKSLQILNVVLALCLKTTQSGQNWYCYYFINVGMVLMVSFEKMNMTSLAFACILSLMIMILINTSYNVVAINL